MRSFWSDPYLWIHLAGLAALPIWLELCFLGLAVGDPIFPVWLDLAFVAIVGIAPILWMQWQRPFYIFSLLAIALKPEKLTLAQRQLLTRFKSTQNRLLAIAVAILLAIVLRQGYVFAPIAAAVVPFSIESRGLGLLIAAIAFLGCNLFLQVPISVASVMLTSDSAFASTKPYPLEQISQHFTSLGLPVSQLLPEFLENWAIASPPMSTPVVVQPEVAHTQKALIEEPEFAADGAAVVPSMAELPSAAVNTSDLPPLEAAAITEALVEAHPEAIRMVEVNAAVLEEIIVAIEEIEAIAEIGEAEIAEAEGPEAEVAEAEIAKAEVPEAEIAEAEIAEAADIKSETANSSAAIIDPAQSGDEVEQASLEDLEAIARIDQQPVSEAFSTEASEHLESDPD